MTGKPRGQQEKTDRDLIMARWTGVVGIFTAALAVISLVTAVIFWRQLSVMQGQLDITKRALVAVERPILLLTMNSAFVFEAGHPRFEIKIQNVGKQIGLITGVTASFVSQDDTIPPPPSQPFKDDGSACVIHTGDGHYMIERRLSSQMIALLYTVIGNASLLPRNCKAYSIGYCLGLSALALFIVIQ